MKEVPQDPLGGVVNYLDTNRRFPADLVSATLCNVAASLGLGVYELSNNNPEDQRLIDALSGVNSPEQELLSAYPPNEDVLRMSTKVENTPIVFLSRPTCEGVDDSPDAFKQFAERLEKLHDTVRDIAGRGN